MIISVHPLRTDLRRPSCLVISCHCPLLSSNRKGPLLVHHSLFQQLLSQHHRCIHSLTRPLLVLGSNVPSLPGTVVCLKEKPKKSLSLIIPNQKPNSNDLTTPSLIGLVESQYSARKKGTAGGSKVVVITFFDPRHNHLPSSTIFKVSFVLPSGIWDCRFVFI